MTYNLKFLFQARKEWDRLDNSIKKQFKKNLIEILENPYVNKNKL